MSGEITPFFYLALLTIAILGIFLQLKHYSLPVHADSGEFIYRGVLEREGEKFKIRGVTRNWKYLLFAYRHYSLTNFQDQDGCPAIQNKELVYRLMTWFFRGSQFKAKDFRLLFFLYHGCTILMMGVLGEASGGPYAGLGTALLFAFFSASPFSDPSQIHAEHYATLPMAAACTCLLVGLKTGGEPWLVAAGFLLVLVTLLIKLTYGAEFIFLGILVLGVGGPGGLVHYLLGLAIFLALLTFIYGCRGQGKNLYLWLIQTALWIKDYRANGKVLRSEVSGLTVEGEGDQSSLWNQVRRQEKYHVFLRQVLPLFVGAGLFMINLIVNGLTITAGLILVWGVAAVLSVNYQKKYYLSHTVPLLSPAVLMSGMMVPIILLPPLTTYKILSIFIICCSFIYSWPAWRPYLSCPDPLQYHCRLYKTLENLNTLRALAVEPIAQYLHEKTTQGERILQ